MRNSLHGAAGFENLTKTPSLHVANVGSILFTKFGETLSVDDLTVLGKHQLAVVKRAGSITIISLVSVGAGVGRIGDDIRQESLEMMNALGKSCLGSATVVLGGGLGTTVVRMFLTGFNLVSRTPFPQKTFSSVQDALTWAQQLPGQSLDAKRVTSEAIMKHFEMSDDAPSEPKKP